MSDDLIVQRLIEIYNQKILTKQEMSVFKYCMDYLKMKILELNLIA